MIEGFSEEEIILYLKGKASKKLAERIEAAVINNDELAQIIHKDRSLSTTSQRESLKDEIGKVHYQLKKEGFFEKVFEEIQEEKSGTNIFRKYMPYIAAASLIGFLITFYLVFYNKIDPFKEHYSQLPDFISRDIELIVENRDTAKAHLDYIDLLDAMKSYNSSDYITSVNLLKTCIENEDIKYDRKLLMLYLAISELELKRYDSAFNHLKELSKEKNLKYFNDIVWYLSYSSYKLNNIDQAKKYLEMLKSDDKYGSKSKTILSKLQ